MASVAPPAASSAAPGSASSAGSSFWVRLGPRPGTRRSISRAKGAVRGSISITPMRLKAVWKATSAAGASPPVSTAMAGAAQPTTAKAARPVTTL